MFRVSWSVSFWAWQYLIRVLCGHTCLKGCLYEYIYTFLICFMCLYKLYRSHEYIRRNCCCCTKSWKTSQDSPCCTWRYFTGLLPLLEVFTGFWKFFVVIFTCDGQIMTLRNIQVSSERIYLLKIFLVS